MSITDPMILDDIAQGHNMFNSELFELFGHKWFISICPPGHHNNINKPYIGLKVRCILDHGRLSCAIELKIKEINIKHLYYERFTEFTTTEWYSSTYCSRSIQFVFKIWKN